MEKKNKNKTKKKTKKKKNRKKTTTNILKIREENKGSKFNDFFSNRFFLHFIRRPAYFHLIELNDMYADVGERFCYKEQFILQQLSNGRLVD